MSVEPKQELEFDGERFVPGSGVEITYHHWLRYLLAAQIASGKRALDVASGEGYGAAYLAETAAHVDAFDANAPAVAHARAAYADHPALSFSCARIDDFFGAAQPGSYDLVTAFEIIEHVDEATQRRLLDGIRNVLAPGGVALVSTPDKQLYSDVRLSKNPFHVREMYRNEFAQLCETVFPSVRIFEQLTFTGSAVFRQGARHGALAEMSWSDLLRLKGRARPGVEGGGEYLVAAMAMDDAALEELDSIVLLDRSRKLTGEELYARQVEADHLRDVVEDLQRQNEELRRAWLSPEEAKRRHDLQQAVIDRLVAIIRRDAEGVAGRSPGELGRLLEQERQRREELEQMVSMKVIRRAKQVWDRFPTVKNAVKSIVKPFV